MDLGVIVLSMMTRVLLTLLIGLVVSLGALVSMGTSAAFAETFECKRHTQGNSSFKTQSDFELWFPKEISLDIYNWKSREGYKSLKKVENLKQYMLLPDGKMIASLVGYSDSLGKALVWQTVPRRVQVNHIRYNCNRTSLELIAGFDRKSGDTQTASVPVQKAKSKVTSAALSAAEKEAERLSRELATLKAEKAKQQQTISSDNQKPTIQIAGTASNGPQGTIKGFVRDNTGVAEVRVDGKLVKVDSYGNFVANTYVPEGGVSVSIQAVDLAGLSSSMSVRLDRSASNRYCYHL